ncbi:D-alanyl-D-alanine carboxypeptidase [Anthropogastromicrobium aceti]|uniref:D-alanyl-D-alanine carboxypeptidase family protein n=1 Tax=Anthropogastromicrobium aceti TaxID=2981768 RepID=UPI000821144B|nr:D-alanyl-D-alanine carboxypeptidase family protein [Anthropogastromicrobium aceti]MCU6783214.1 D-alanyl-D-alanine carboxypeptidase [Anthropogastromicrobium aceti]SCJ19222.1 D-alanyl-D-alanine carboxypeptidase dacB precursor [uncultured Lachnospira sp.]
MKKRIWIAFLCLIILGTTFGLPQPSCADETTGGILLTCPSAILMEASTKSVIYEKAPDERRSPASITKIMTAILIFDAIEAGKISLEDEVVTSAYAKSMGGSQVYLEEGEKQTVDTLIKCIMVSSGNDASVAMAEYIAGSESSFVQMMNERAASLGMENTHFEDCCGLTDSDNHYTTARDIALMAQELITRYPQIKSYTTIWMENITHVTMQGSKEFGLANTNKLLKQYPYTTGLKTGSTNKAKYCVCATANKDGVELIAVIMGCPNYKDRFTEAQSLLQFGYTTCKLYQDENPPELMPILVKGGIDKQVPAVYKEKFSWLFVSGEDFSNMEKMLTTNELTAPIEKGEQIGTVTYRLNGKELGSIGIYAGESVREAKFFDYLLNIVLQWMAVI